MLFSLITSSRGTHTAARTAIMLILVQALTTPITMQAIAISALAIEAKLLYGLARPAMRFMQTSCKRLAQMHREVPRRRIANPLKGTAASASWRYALRLNQLQRESDKPAVTLAADTEGGSRSPHVVTAVIGLVVLILLVVAQLMHARRNRLICQATLKLQSAGRALRPRLLYRLRRAAILKVQSYARGRAEVRRQAASVIQAEARRFLAQRALATARAAAILIQADMRRWRTYWLAGAALDARLIVRGELGTGLKRRRLAVERLEAASRKLGAATRVDAALLISRVTRGFLARKATRAATRALAKRRLVASKASQAACAKPAMHATAMSGASTGREAGTRADAKRHQAARLANPFSPMQPRQLQLGGLEHQGGGGGTQGGALSARELLDELTRIVKADVVSSTPSNLLLSASSSSSSLSSLASSSSPRNSSSRLLRPPALSSVGVVCPPPPPPSAPPRALSLPPAKTLGCSPTPRRGAGGVLVGSVMGELKGRLAIRRRSIRELDSSGPNSPA